MTMLAARITAPKTIEIVELPVPDVAAGQVRVRLLRAALCGSDYPYYTVAYDRASYPFPPGYPGHECLGVVEASRAADWREGDLVMYYPPGLDAYRTHHIADPARLQKLPAGRDLETLLMTQLLGAVSHAAFRIDRPYNKTVVIMGQGPVGLLFTSLMGMFGARQVIAVDPLEWRRDAARIMGATYALDPGDGPLENTIDAITAGHRADIVIDAFGQDLAVTNRCFDLAAHGGQVAFFGIVLEEAPRLNFNLLFRRELRMVASVGPDLTIDYPYALDMILSGRVDVVPLITHVMPFADIQEAFMMATERRPGVIKIVLDMNA